MLHTPNAINEIAAVAAKTELDRQLSVIKEVTDNHQAFVQLLNEVTQSFLDTGVGRLPDNNWYWCGFREGTRWDWSHYISRLAKDMERPFVFCYGATLSIEKKAYTRPLYAHLLLIAADGGHTQLYDWQTKNAARQKDVSFTQTGGRIIFEFNTEQGRKLLAHWLEQTKTDPDFRKALRLPG